VWLAGTLVGTPAAAVLTVNNYRDRDPDRAAGKRTLAVRLGRPATRRVYAALVGLPLVLGPLGWLLGWLPPGALAPSLLLPWAVALVGRFRREPPGPGFNGILAQTAGYQLAAAALFSAGLFLDPA
jgi:1,4-dihydroxy-2-naphthoate octaprenyltransferase